MYQRVRYYMFICFIGLTYFSYGQQDSCVSCAMSCCGTDLTPSGVMISHLHPKKQWMFSYRYMSMSMGHMQNGTQSVSDIQVYNNYVMTSSGMRMDMHMLMGMYGLSNKITLMGMLNYNYSSMGMKMLPTTYMVMPDGEIMGSKNAPSKISTQGLGDTKIYVLYGLVNTRYHHLLLSGGISIPTGSIQVEGSSSSMYQQRHVPYMMQMGSGTWDLMPGITYLHSKGTITWSSQLSSVVHPGYNSLNYSYGNSATFTSWIGWKWYRLLSSTLRVEASATGVIKGYDVNIPNGYEPSASPLNYGGQHINGYIGTNFYLPIAHVKSRIAVEYGLPIYQSLNGTQMTTKSTLYTTWSWVF
jgi:hypothetical protein